MNLALAIQQVTEEAVFRLAKTAKKLTGCENLVMAGGVALNCVANGLLVQKNIFKDIWIQPAAGHAGGALGAALAAWYQYSAGKVQKKKPHTDEMYGSYLGPCFGETEILSVAEKCGASYEHHEDFEKLSKKVARLIADGNIVGWFQGRMEWGPRALGNRSILGDPRNPEMQKRLNLKIKYREGFRPFAPAVMAEEINTFFDLARPTPYMLFVAPVRESLRNPLPENYSQLGLFEKLYHQRSNLPAVTHVDFSARIQTVHKETNPRFWQLLSDFQSETGIGMLINTSFNVRGEPIVCSPEDAYRCFMHTEMDYLIMGNTLFRKEDTPSVSVDSPVPLSTWEKHLDILCCPKCSHDLKSHDNMIVCSSCGASFETLNNIPLLFTPNEEKEVKNDVTDNMRAFYEETPFPNYDDFDDVSSLIMKSRKGVFAKLLDEQIIFNGRILECGCGTGQLTNFLSIAHRTVFGTDMTINSLQLGQEFKEKHNLNRANFFQMNLFRPCFKKESFDVVISNGVLHHTSDPFSGLQSIASLVKPGGYIVYGLYHKYGRLITDFRRHVFNLTNDQFKFLDKRIVDSAKSFSKKDAWFKDQYKNPHESKHTIGESLRWLDTLGFKFINSIPKTKLFESFSNSEELFLPNTPGNYFERFITEIAMIPSGRDEGGFFIIIAKKPFNQKNTGAP